MPETLAEILDELTMPGQLFKKLDKDAVQCSACAHRCVLKPGQRGICNVRFNRDGVLRVPVGYVISAQTDPIEKKPFAHFLPGSDALSFGMVGCNFHCDFCQNWTTAQALCEPAAHLGPEYIRQITPEKMIAYGRQTGAQVVASTYNEPLITTEWAVEIFRQAKLAGMKCVYVSNGFATPEVLKYLLPHLDGFKIDLKSMQPEHYREMGGRLKPVLETIQEAVEAGLWVEVVTLLIPGFNDSREEMWETARFLTSVSPDIPWHVTAFHPDYKRRDVGSTPASTLRLAAEVGQEAGLRYVYAGNLSGRVGSLENTYCPYCQTLLIERRGFSILDYKITAAGKCPKCGTDIAGVWPDRPEEVNRGSWGLPRRVSW